MHISKLLAQTRTSHKKHLHRYGIAFEIEHGFLASEEGQKQYALQLSAIKSSVLDTTALLGIEALVRSHTVEFHKTHFQRIQNHNDAKRVEQHMLSFPGSLVCIQIV